VLQHHNNLNRDGLYIDGALTQSAIKTLAVDTSFAGAKVSANVYAQPLYWAGTGGNPDLVIVADEANNVYAFNASSGAQVWTKNLGTPVNHSGGTGAGGDLDCGGISPTVGVTGTPVIDGATGTLYLDAFQVDVSGSTRTPAHKVHALDVTTGNEQTGWPVDLNSTASSNGTTFTSKLQNNRAALTFVGGQVFVPFSGHIGDCDGYHGWVVGITAGSSPKVNAWATRAVAGGVWGASGIASDGTSLFFATGNTKASASSGPTGSSPATWGDGETVYKFPTTLVAPAMTTPGTTTDYWVPSNWASLDNTDSDVGGTSPAMVDIGSSQYLLALGKDHNAYLLNRTNLGGMDATALVGPTAVAKSNIITAAATYTTSSGTYVVFGGGAASCPSGTSGGLTALKITAGSSPAVTTAWCGGASTSRIPSVSQSDGNHSDTIVWAVGSDGNLYGVDGDTGKTLVSTAIGSPVSPVQSIQTPIVAGGRVFVSSSSQVYAFKP